MTSTAVKILSDTVEALVYCYMSKFGARTTRICELLALLFFQKKIQIQIRAVTAKYQCFRYITQFFIILAVINKQKSSRVGMGLIMSYWRHCYHCHIPQHVPLPSGGSRISQTEGRTPGFGSVTSQRQLSILRNRITRP